MTWFTYVFPCLLEDHCKVGFSRDPLVRIAQLHQRWFEFFDLDGGMLVETETEREARDLELALRRPLVLHKAPQPLAIRRAAGGHTEWLRGASECLHEDVARLQADGQIVHAPLRSWMRHALGTRSDLLYDWASAQLSPDELECRITGTTAQRVARDMLDAHVALGIGLDALLPPSVLDWYRR